MAKMWAGRTDGTTEKIADDFNSSILFDSRMYRQDITGSMAHTAMLKAKNIITELDAEQLLAKAFKLEEVSGGSIHLPDVVSRKKQVIPKIMSASNQE